MTTPNPEPENTLPKEFISNLTTAFSETFYAWASANNLPRAIINGVDSALLIAECGQTMHVTGTGEQIASITNAIVLMGGSFHSGDGFSPARPMLMLESRDAQAQAGHDSDLIDKLISEEVAA